MEAGGLRERGRRADGLRRSKGTDLEERDAEYSGRESTEAKQEGGRGLNETGGESESSHDARGLNVQIPLAVPVPRRPP